MIIQGLTVDAVVSDEYSTVKIQEAKQRGLIFMILGKYDIRASPSYCNSIYPLLAGVRPLHAVGRHLLGLLLAQQGGNQRQDNAK